MMRSSMGYHTFSISQRLSIEEEYALNTDFYASMGNGGQITKENIKTKKGQVIGIEYAYKNSTGIRWRVFNMEGKNNFRIYSVQAIITPRVLLKKDYINVATELDIQNFKSAFNNEARKISPILMDFDSYSMKRSDYCANFDLEELNMPCTKEQMMKLLKRADIPAHFAERTEYNPTSHRRKTDKDTFYLESKSVTINCYDKYEQLKKDPNHPCPNKEDAKNIIRFEIQCKYPKLYAMSKNYMQVTTDPEPLPPQFSIADEMYELYEELAIRRQITLPVDAFLSNTISFDMIETYFRRIVRSGDYYTLTKARHIIEALDCQPKRKEKLIKALEMTNAYRGIYNTKLRLEDKALLEYNRLLIDLDKLRINPVTIPREWGIEYIPNLLTAYHEKRIRAQNDEERREGEMKLLIKRSK